jgi:hypothetical protein
MSDRAHDWSYTGKGRQPINRIEYGELLRLHARHGRRCCCGRWRTGWMRSMDRLQPLGLARRDPLGRRQTRAPYSMYPVLGSTFDRKFRIASSWSTMLAGRPSDDAEENP